MNDKSLMNAALCESVVAGTCVMLVDGSVVYAGPIKDAPDTSGKLVLLNSVDFEKLKKLVDRRRH